MNGAHDFADEVRTGLTAERKSIPPRWFYDQLGSALFDAICFLPEYYVTRAETEILSSYAADIAACLGRNIRLVELGSGMARKTRILLDRLGPLEYVPIDVDDAILERSGRELLSEYRSIRVTPIKADFALPSKALETLPSHDGRTVVFFLGSTIGNLDPQEATEMLRDLRSALRPGDALLLGVDLRKPSAILEPAYNDSLGVTAAFNLNLLARINRELSGHFDLGRFRHHAFYDQKLGRIEMHLVSDGAQRVRIDALGLEIAFTDGESIHTESSWKHDDDSLGALAAGSGFKIEKIWTDSRCWFADVLMVA